MFQLQFGIFYLSVVLLSAQHYYHVYMLTGQFTTFMLTVTNNFVGIAISTQLIANTIAIIAYISYLMFVGKLYSDEWDDVVHLTRIKQTEALVASVVIRSKHMYMFILYAVIVQIMKILVSILSIKVRNMGRDMTLGQFFYIKLGFFMFILMAVYGQVAYFYYVSPVHTFNIFALDYLLLCTSQFFDFLRLQSSFYSLYYTPNQDYPLRAYFTLYIDFFNEVIKFALLAVFIVLAVYRSIFPVHLVHEFLACAIGSINNFARLYRYTISKRTLLNNLNDVLEADFWEKDDHHPEMDHTAEGAPAKGYSRITCSICRSELDGNVRKLVCNHKFHLDCIFGWMEKDHRCPICRVSVNSKPQPGNTSVNSTTTNNNNNNNNNNDNVLGNFLNDLLGDEEEEEEEEDDDIADVIQHVNRLEESSINNTLDIPSPVVPSSDTTNNILPTSSIGTEEASTSTTTKKEQPHIPETPRTSTRIPPQSSLLDKYSKSPTPKSPVVENTSNEVSSVIEDTVITSSNTTISLPQAKNDEDEDSNPYINITEEKITTTTTTTTTTTEENSTNTTTTEIPEGEEIPEDLPVIKNPPNNVLNEDFLTSYMHPSVNNINNIAHLNEKQLHSLLHSKINNLSQSFDAYDATANNQYNVLEGKEHVETTSKDKILPNHPTILPTLPTTHKGIHEVMYAEMHAAHESILGCNLDSSSMNEYLNTAAPKITSSRSVSLRTYIYTQTSLLQAQLHSLHNTKQIMLMEQARIESQIEGTAALYNTVCDLQVVVGTKDGNRADTNK